MSSFLTGFEFFFTVLKIYLERTFCHMTIKTVDSIMTLKTMPEFGNGDGEWSKMNNIL